MSPTSTPSIAACSRILVVDDERLIADTLALILNRSGFCAMAAYNGLQALEKAAEWFPDLLLSDIVMPEMNGIEAAIRIRSTNPGCKVLLFSGQATIDTLLQNAVARRQNFEVLAKPIHPRDLLARLRDMLATPNEYPKRNPADEEPAGLQH